VSIRPLATPLPLVLQRHYFVDGGRTKLLSISQPAQKPQPGPTAPCRNWEKREEGKVRGVKLHLHTAWERADESVSKNRHHEKNGKGELVQIQLTIVMRRKFLLVQSRKALRRRRTSDRPAPLCANAQGSVKNPGEQKI
jgi:hypothetical protein